MTCTYNRDDIKVTFAPENSNIRYAFGRTKSLITQLRKKGPQALKDSQEQIDKKIELGTLERITEEEHEKVKLVSETSDSTTF